MEFTRVRFRKAVNETCDSALTPGKTLLATESLTRYTPYRGGNATLRAHADRRIL